MSDLAQHVEFLGAAEWDARHTASRMLAEARPAALPAINAGLSHPNWRVRRGCADLLDHLAISDSTAPLRRLLHDPVPAVRRLALHAVACQRCKVAPLEVHTVAELSRLALSDRSTRVRRAAAHQLGCQPPDARAATVLQQILGQDSDAKLIRIARWAMSRHV